MTASDAHGAGEQRQPRQRNRRGEGHLLRDQIVATAADLLERTGSEYSLSLRAIAREIGIAPPSVARHFATVADLIDVVVARELARLAAVIDQAAEDHVDLVDRYYAFTRAYVRFGQQLPATYRVLFERRFLPMWADEQRAMPETAPLFAGIFTTVADGLQACIDTGRSTSTDAITDTVAVWYFLHGMIALPSAITSFPWPDSDVLLRATVGSLAGLTN